MLRSLYALTLASAALAAVPAAAQLPPSIRKPIEAAKKAAGATNASVQASQKTGEGTTTGAQPAAAAQAAGKSVQGGAKGAPPGAVMTKTDSLKAKAVADSASRRGSASQSGGKGMVVFYREEFVYDAENRRDPFLSLLVSGELKPLLADLALIGVLYDEGAPNRSIAVLEDASNKDTYRVRVSDVLGRMKVVKISKQEVTFSIDEFGFSRQESLPLDMTRKAGGQPGRRPQ